MKQVHVRAITRQPRQVLRVVTWLLWRSVWPKAAMKQPFCRMFLRFMFKFMKLTYVQFLMKQTGI